jgi:glycine cleavage system H protein
MTPDDRRYTRSHEWVKLEGDTAVVGITDHAQEALGDVTFVEPPDLKRAVKAGGACGVIESVKAASDLFAPVGGTVSEVNGELEDHPEIVNQDPYGRGWLFKLAGVQAADVAALLDAAGYEAAMKEESGEG